MHPPNTSEVFHLYSLNSRPLILLPYHISYHIHISLPHIRTGTSNVSCKTLAHSRCKSLALTRGLIAPVTLFPLATFLLHSAPSVPDSFKPHPKYLNSKICSKRVLYTLTPHTNLSSPFSIITLLLPALIFPSPSTYLNKSSNHLPQFLLQLTTYKRPDNLHSLPSSSNFIPLLPSPSSPPSSLDPCIHLTAKGT